MLAVYPVIDAAASVTERRTVGSTRAEPSLGVAFDGLAIIGLLVATLSLHTQSALIVWDLGFRVRSPATRPCLAR